MVKKKKKLNKNTVEMPADVTEPRKASLYVNDSQLKGIGKKKVGDKVKLIVNGRVKGIREGYDSKSLDADIEVNKMKHMKSKGTMKPGRSVNAV